MTEERATVLEADGLRVVVSGVEILCGVSLGVAAGEVLGVLGPSGAGKSTLFRALAGELTPKAGSVWLHGKDATRLPLWRRARLGLGYLPQLPSVLLDLSVRDNLRTYARLAGVARPSVIERADEIGLKPQLDTPARELSGGERRRLELLRALTGEPSVLICDEPFAALDPAGARRVGELLRRRSEAGGAVLIADHRVRDALDVCDRVALLAEGRIEIATSCADFAAHPAVRERYLG